MGISSGETSQIIAQQQAEIDSLLRGEPIAGYGAAPPPSALTAPGVVPSPGAMYTPPEEPTLAGLATPVYDPRNPPSIISGGPGPHVYGRPGGQPLPNIAAGMAAQGVGMATTGVETLAGALAFGAMMIGDVPLGQSLIPHPTNIMDPVMGSFHGATLGMRGAMAAGGVEMGGVGAGFWNTLRGVGGQLTSGAAGRAIGTRALGAGAMGGAMAALPYMAVEQAFEFGAENLMAGAQQQVAQQQFWSQVPRSAMPKMQGQMGSEWALGVGNMMRDMTTANPQMDMGELQGIMSNMVGTGQMFDVQGMGDFERKFKQNLDALKIVARTMNTSLTDAQAFLDEQRSMGFLSPEAGAMNVAFGRGVAVTSGLQAGTMPVIAQQGAQVGWQMGMTRMQGAVMAEQNVGNIGYSVMSGKISQNALMEATGAGSYDEAMAAFSGQMLQAGAAYVGGPRGQLLSAALANEDVTGIDPSKARMFGEGAYSESDLKRMAKETRERGGKTGRMRLQHQGDLFQQQIMQMVDPTALITQDVRGMVEERYAGMDPEQQGIMEDVLMEKYAGLGRRDAALVRKAGEQGPIVREEMKRRIMQEMQSSQTPEMSIDMIWEGIKQKYVGQYLDPVRQQIQQYGAQITQWGSGIVEDAMKDILGVSTTNVGKGFDTANQIAMLGYTNRAQMYDPYAAMQRAGAFDAPFGMGGAVNMVQGFGGGVGGGMGGGYAPPDTMGLSSFQAPPVSGGFSGMFPVTSAVGQMGAMGAPFEAAGWGIQQGGAVLGGMLGRAPTVGGLLDVGVSGVTGLAGGAVRAPGRMLTAPARFMGQQGMEGLAALRGAPGLLDQPLGGLFPEYGGARGGAVAGGRGLFGMPARGALATAPTAAAANVLGAGLGGYEFGSYVMGRQGFNMPDYESMDERTLAQMQATGTLSYQPFRTTGDIKVGEGQMMVGEMYEDTGGLTPYLTTSVGLLAQFGGGLGGELLGEQGLDVLKYGQPMGVAKIADVEQYYQSLRAGAVNGVGDIEQSLAFGNAYKSIKRMPSQDELGRAFLADMERRGATLPKNIGDLSPGEKARITAEWAAQSPDETLASWGKAVLKDPRNVIAAGVNLNNAVQAAGGPELGIVPTRGEAEQEFESFGKKMSEARSTGSIWDKALDKVFNRGDTTKLTGQERMDRIMGYSDVSLTPTFGKKGSQAARTGLAALSPVAAIGSELLFSEAGQRFMQSEMVAKGVSWLDAVSELGGAGLGATFSPTASRILKGAVGITGGGGEKRRVTSETFAKIFEGNIENAPEGALRMFNEFTTYTAAKSTGEDVPQELQNKLDTLVMASPAWIAKNYGISEDDAIEMQRMAKELSDASPDDAKGILYTMKDGTVAQRKAYDAAVKKDLVDPYRANWGAKKGGIRRTLTGGEMGAAGAEMLDLMDQIVNAQEAGNEDRMGELMVQYNQMAIKNPKVAEYLAGQSSDVMSQMITSGGIRAEYYKGRLQRGKGDKATGVGLESAIKTIYGGVDKNVLQDIMSAGRGEGKTMTKLGIVEQERLTQALAGTGVDTEEAAAITNMVARFYENGSLDKAESEQLAARLANAGLSPQVAGEIMTTKKGGLNEFVEQLGPATENMTRFNEKMEAFLKRTETSPIFRTIT